MEKNKFCFKYFSQPGQFEKSSYFAQVFYYSYVPGTNNYFEITPEEYNKYYEILASYFKSIKRTDIVQTVVDVRSLFSGAEESFLNVMIRDVNRTEEVSYSNGDMQLCSFSYKDRNKEFKVYNGENINVELLIRDEKIKNTNQYEVMSDINKCIEKIATLRSLKSNKQLDKQMIFNLFTAKHLCEDNLSLRFEEAPDGGQLIIPTKKLIYTPPKSNEETN